MANILTVDLPSDDDQDDDFDPTKDGGGSGDEKKRRAASRKRLRAGGPLGADSGVRDEHEEVCSPVSLHVAHFFMVASAVHWPAKPILSYVLLLAKHFCALSHLCCFY